MSSTVTQGASALEDTIQVTGGRIRGQVRGGLSVFKGIPFAAPPTGDLRWKAPQPVAPWSGVLAADDYGPACPQDTSMYPMIGLPVPPMDEDCLYLNVWAPEGETGAPLPVMVWIYGGAFLMGATSLYDCENLARKGVIVVSVAYRVGVLGFLAHPELSHETGHGSGNYGLLDQIAGLKWVRDNIAAFGGDPANVTVFGESAGAISVSMLAASPLAKGLFHKAISQSGGAFTPPRLADEGGHLTPAGSVAEAWGERFVASMGATGIEEARRIPIDKIMATPGAGMDVPIGTGFWPNFDGYVLPGDQYELYAAGRQNDTPILIGTNSDEGAMFTPPTDARAFADHVRGRYGERAEAVLGAYPARTDAEANLWSKHLFRDAVFAWPTWAWARLQARTGQGGVYAYYFDHRTPFSPDGAGHASEIALVFGNLVAAIHGPDDAAMSELMSSYWINFAKTGDPNGPGLPAWPRFDEERQLMMHFDQQSSARPTPNAAQLEALEDYFAWRRQQWTSFGRNQPSH